MTTRIYHPEPLSPGLSVILKTSATAHVSKALRLKENDSLTLFNGDGCDYKAAITDIDRNRVTALITGQQNNNAESPLPVTLMQGICRNQRMDLLIQKSTELGIHQISPIHCERSVSKIDNSRQDKKLHHWHNVAASACEQSGRACIPTINEPANIEMAVLKLQDNTVKLLLDPDGDNHLDKALQIDQPVALLIGPEGGLTKQEIEIAVSLGFKRVRLGPRVLRTETAPITALSIIQFLAGDLNR